MTKLNLDIYINAVELMDIASKNEDGSYWKVNGDSAKENNLDINVYDEEEFVRLARECGSIITMTCNEGADHQTATFMYKGLSVSTYVWEYDRLRFDRLLKEIQ